MLTEKEFENVLSKVRSGMGLRQALIEEGKILDVNMQNWFLEDSSREAAYLSAKKSQEAVK